MKDSRLHRGDKIRILSDAPNPVTGVRPEREVEYHGMASIKVKGRWETLPWHERGITWRCDKLDRLDAKKDEFSKAATGGIPRHGQHQGQGPLGDTALARAGHHLEVRQIRQTGRKERRILESRDGRRKESMNDIIFSASLKSAKLTARKNPDHPDTVIRRLQFSLTTTFGHEEAVFLGQVGIELLRNLQGRVLNKGEIPINAYHARAEFTGSMGNSIADIDGLVAKAYVVGNEDQEHEEITFDFEAPCSAGLLVFFGLSLKEHIVVDLKRTRLEINFGTPNESGIRTATVPTEHEMGALEGTGEGGA